MAVLIGRDGLVQELRQCADVPLHLCSRQNAQNPMQSKAVMDMALEKLALSLHSDVRNASPRQMQTRG
eukprot:3452152-Amphidinium_carterae.2